MRSVPTMFVIYVRVDRRRPGVRDRVGILEH
jgi:hypothetical protein